MRRWLGSLALLLPLMAAAQPVLRMAAPTNLTEPLARFEHGQLHSGLLKELGDLLAAELRRRPQYVSLPSKRVSEALQDGRAQLVCYVMPGWLDGDLRWTQPVIPAVEVLAARADAPRVRSLDALAGERVGTVLGYRYAHLRAAGQPALTFQREDAPDSRANLAKLGAGRVRYAIVDTLALREQQRRRPELGLRQELELSRYTTQCALGPKADLSLADVNQALDALQRDGRLPRLLARYGD